MAAVILDNIPVTGIFPVQMYDYTIIGMGIVGCYLAYRINSLYPHKKVLCIERDNRYGGRILSVRWNGTVVDLGAWRYSPDEHKVVQSLVDRFNIDTVPILTPTTMGTDGTLPISPSVDIDAISLVEYLYSLGWDSDRVRSYIDSTGYNIFGDDIPLREAISTSGSTYRYMRYGYIQLCNHLINATNDNVHVRLGTDVSSLSSYRPYDRMFVTVQPNALSRLYNTPILSSMVGYDAIRIYLYTDHRIGPSMYTSTTPLRKMYVLDGGYILVYVDGSDARILQSLLTRDISLIQKWVRLMVGVPINIISYIYRYWEDAIFFWRPGYSRDIDTPFTYINCDVSTQPGWVNGGLLMVDTYM